MSSKKHRKHQYTLEAQSNYSRRSVILALEALARTLRMIADQITELCRLLR